MNRNTHSAVRFADKYAAPLAFGILLCSLTPVCAQNASPGQPGTTDKKPAASTDSMPKAPGNSGAPNSPTMPPVTPAPTAPVTPGATPPLPTDQTPKPHPGRSTPPPPTNPLLLPPAQGGVQANLTDKATAGALFGDYRQPSDPGPANTLKSFLPVFGYDFFQPARELIMARRAFLKRQYQGPQQDTTSGTNAAQNGQNNGQSPDNNNGSPTVKPTDPTGSIPPILPLTTKPQPGRTVTLPDGSVITLPAAAPLIKQPGVPANTNDSAGQTGALLPGAGGSVPGAGALGQQQNGPNSGGLTAGQNPVSSGRPDGANAPVNGFEEVADPLAQLYRNVLATVPPTYQLAAGDSLSIRYWSPRHEARTLAAVVNGQGALILDDMGSIILRGLTMEQAERAVSERIRRYYNKAEVSMTLSKLRTIQVTVSGAAFQPGTYTVPAVASAYNVLYASGGPLEDGSLRSVEVRRNGTVVGTLDLYNFLLVGSHSADIALQSGDLIYIPRRRSHVRVSGEVLQEAVFELRATETLQDVLKYCGGVKASAVNQRIRISTLDPGHERILKDVDLNKVSGSAVPLYDGDEVEAFSVRPLIANTVAVEGAIDQPSSYALTPGMKVSDLIERARGFTGEAYLVRANLYRWNSDNTTTLLPIDLQKALAHDPSADVALSRWDRLTVFSRKDVAWIGQRNVTIRGAVQRAGSYTLSDNMHVSDLVLLAGGPTPEAYTERAILLHQHGDGTYAMEYVSLDRLSSKDPSTDLRLQDNDVLAVYRTGEAQFEPDHTVAIQGEVVASGSFPRSAGMKLSDLINLAGGFRPNASTTVSVAHARRIVQGTDNGIRVVTVAFDNQRKCAPKEDALLEDGDVVTVQGVGGYEPHVQVVRVQGAVNRPGPIIISGKNMRLSDALKAAGGLRPEAFPSGAEFYRDPKNLNTDSQLNLASVIGNLNDLLNETAYNRERGKSYVERIRSISSASQSDAPAAAGGQAAAPTNIGALATQLAQQELVSPARKLTDDQMNANGNIAINLPAAIHRPQGPDDVLLNDGDTITIPETPTTVQVVGAVFHGRGVLYRPGAKLDYYIEQSGGFAPDAARDRIEIIHVGGGLIPASKTAVIQPGDLLLVPTRVLAEKLNNNQNGISSFFKSLTNSAIVFRVATSLFGL